MSETWGFELQRWVDIVESCELSLAGIGRKFEIAKSNLSNWFYHGVIPNNKSKAKMEAALRQIENTKRIPFHPSFGYATAEQIEKLKTPLQEWERNKIMEQIVKQTKLRGKID